MTAPMPSSPGPSDRDQRSRRDQLGNNNQRGDHDRPSDPHRCDPNSQPYNPWAAPPSADPAGQPSPTGAAASVRRELREAAIVAAAVTAVGVLLGILWVWLAPRVPVISNGSLPFLRDSESEEAIGADGTFTLLAMGIGAITGAVAFWCRRRGGVGLVCGLFLGALLGSVLAWRLGVWLGPPQDAVARARELGAGAVFDAPLQLRAKGALLVWPVAALAAHLGLTALFGPREPQPPEHPQWGPSPEA